MLVYVSAGFAVSMMICSVYWLSAAVSDETTSPRSGMLSLYFLGLANAAWILTVLYSTHR